MPQPNRPPLPENVVSALNAARGGFNKLIGLEFTEVSYEKVVAKLEVVPALHQPYGLVHGGVYSSMIETLASAAAAVNVMANGSTTVGLENSTSFIRAVRDGWLTATATPLTRGRRTQVWQVIVTSEDGKIAASGRVRMLVLESQAGVAGETLQIKPDPS